MFEKILLSILASTQVLLLILKVCGVLALSWWLVFIPVYLVVLFFILFALMVLIFW